MDRDALRSIFSDASLAGWSLRSDVQLQEWLEGFAERLKERTKEVAAEVDRLGTETAHVELHLQNSFNSLRALSATQFIENRVDEVDEVFVNKSEQPLRQSRAEGYDSHIIPRYKEAVLVAWDAFEGFNTNKKSTQASQTRPSLKLPYIIGTEDFSRDIHCGLAASSRFPRAAARTSSPEPVESGSDTDRDEARMAAEMVGGRTWLEGEWSASESETSGHQGGVLEPAVSAALDFKAMLEAALRGPSFPYDIPNLDNVHGQQGFVDNSVTLDAQDTDNNVPRTRSEPGEIKLDGGVPSNYGSQASVEDDMQHQSQGVAPETTVEVNRPVFPQPPPIQMPPVLNRNDFTGPMTPSTPTLNHSLNSPREGFPEDLERSLGISSRINSLPPAETKTQLRPPIATSEELPMPTLPDGLFQGLQVAMQARQLRSHQKDNEATADEVRSPIPAEKSRLPPSKLNVKDNRGGPFSKTTSRLQKESKGALSPVVFQGGLFDDDDDDVEFLSKEATPKEGLFTKVEEKQGGSPFPKQGLFDALSGDAPSGSEAAGANSGRVQQSSLPDWKDAKRSSILKKSLFGDSDNEDSE